MDKNRVKRILESVKALRNDMLEAINEEDIELIYYHFLRAYRLLARLREITVKDKLYIDSETKILEMISSWHENLAQVYERNGQLEEAEREWIAAISFSNNDANHYIQYAHSALKSQNLLVSRDIKDHLPFISKENVRDVQTSLRKARFAVKSAVQIQGLTDPTNYMIGWIDQLEKAIEENEELRNYLNQAPENVSLQETMTELENLIGLEKVKQKVREIRSLVTFNQMRQEQGLKIEQMGLHMVFSGNPGTGKTSVARIIAKILKALGVLKKGHLVEVGRSDLVGEYVGHTAVKTMGKIKEASGGVLFIDEAYSLVRGQGNDFGIEAIDTLVKAMEDQRKDLVLILAGYPKEMEKFLQSNPGLHSRFKTHIIFEDYTIDELMKISGVMLRQKQYRMTSQSKDILRNLIDQRVQEKPDTHGNGRLVRNLIEEAILCKATYVVSNQEKNLPTGELDVIDEAIMKMVEMSFHSDEDRNELLQNKYQSNV